MSTEPAPGRTHFPTFTRGVRCVQSGFKSRIRFFVKVAQVLLVLILLLAAGSVWLRVRAARFRTLAAEHTRPFPWSDAYFSGHEGDRVHYYDSAGNEIPQYDVELSLWHARLKKKYHEASLRPWLPVPADPPSPE